MRGTELLVTLDSAGVFLDQESNPLESPVEELRRYVEGQDVIATGARHQERTQDTSSHRPPDSLATLIDAVCFLVSRGKPVKTPGEHQQFTNATARLREKNGAEVLLVLDLAGVLPSVDGWRFEAEV
ncbi:hypothetical protein D779_3916 [Imhoffiella purpurea]|uniref:Uncharacterized protein n=2 Tax=Imhoffiella purpurea TaxID=1249627 RepID=W9V180_9GAMM|nr:hypothetical protein D779_3916 [Imhoffiella purpurea]